MVYQSFEQRVVKNVALFACFLAGFLAAFVAWRLCEKDRFFPEPEAAAIEAETEITIEELELIDVQPVLDNWLQTLPKGAEVGAVVYDLDNGQIVAEYNAHRIFDTESLYKLFVVYEGYRQVETGMLDSTRKIGDYTVSECLDLAIRESNSVCAEGILRLVGAKNVQKVMEEDFGLTESSVYDLTSTAADMTRMLKVLYEHKDLSAEAWAKLQDSMLNQPLKKDEELCPIVCNYRQGLPAGFSVAKVYDKVGWLGDGEKWIHYNDAAIVEFSELGRNYAVVLMTENVDSSYLAKFGEKFEAEVLNRQ